MDQTHHHNSRPQHCRRHQRGATRILPDHSAEGQPDKQEPPPRDELLTSQQNDNSNTSTEMIAAESNSLPASEIGMHLYSSGTFNNEFNVSASSSSYDIHSNTLRSITTCAPTTTIPTTIPNLLNKQQQTYKITSNQLLPCDIKSLFECPICFDYAVPPIYQCQNGHLVCQCCSGKIKDCPTCRVPISNPSIRNLQLDRLASTFQFPCKFNFNGCEWKSYWFKKREHEEGCEYMLYPCPCPGTACKWTGLLSQVMPHLKESHKSITTLSGEDIVFLATDINLKGAVDWVMIQSCFNSHFLLVLEKQELKSGEQQFFALVQLIGSQKEADKFRYKLELSSNISGQVRRFQWEATPRSSLEGIQTQIASHDCLVFDSKTAQHFLSPIKKDDPHCTRGSDSETSAAEGQGENLGINVAIERIVV